jgi:hypothetical protein
MNEWLVGLGVGIVGLGIFAWIKRVIAARTQPPGNSRAAPGWGEKHEGVGSLWGQWALVLERDPEAAQGKKTIEAFVYRLYRAGLWRYLIKLGFDPIGPAAVSLHETGYGLSYAARQLNNLFGVSYDAGGGKWQPYAYDSIAHCVEHFLKVLSASRYLNAAGLRAHPEEWIRALNLAGYNSAESWRDGCLKAAKMIRDYLGGAK